jgi:hypothetical protein
MKRTVVNGRHVIAAGEVGAYTVCPESWRLRMIASVKAEKSTTKKEGLRLHAEWAKNYDESVHLMRMMRLLLGSLLLATLAYIHFALNN